MESKELRIGNLCVRTNKFTNEMLELELTASCILDISANVKMSSFIYEPIALTEEWLFKFGISSFQDLKVQDYGFLCIETVNDEKVLYIMGNDNPTYSSMFKLNVKYVHQLQNIYFALTGQELKIKAHDPKD